MEEFLNWNAHRLIKAMASKELSAAEVMRATLARIEEVNPGANAIVSLRDPDALIATAQAADAAHQRGPLHGVPIAVKDLADVAGLPTTRGSTVFADTVPRSNEVMVQRMLDAGAIVIGKTNTPEFGLGSHTTNPVFGATRNALLPDRSAGGSSGGAAVALAQRMICLADGSDMMGSLRNPAGWNGVYGMRPTWGRVPSEPVGDLYLHQLSTLGPMARCPQDIARLLEVQAGPDPRRPLTIPAIPFQDGLSADVSGRRIAWLGNWGGAYPMEDGILKASATAVSRLTDAGCVIEDIPPPFDPGALWEAWVTLRSWSVAASLGELYEDPGLRRQLKPEAIWEIEQGLSLTSRQIQDASNIRSDWFRAAARLFDQYNAFALPTAQCWPFPVDWHWPRELNGIAMDTYHRWMEIVVPVSLIGLPCIAAPLPNRQPMGVQLAGRWGDDLGVLQLGQTWHELHAPG